MNAKVIKTELPVSSAQLADLEARYNVQLPEPYRNFLLRHNGGKPIPSSFRSKRPQSRYSLSSVDWFLAVYDGEHDNFETYFVRYKLHQQRLPGNLVPVAHDPGGNLICISVFGSDFGAVYFWDHDREADPDQGETPSYDNVQLLADDFDEFLNRLEDPVYPPSDG